MSAYAHKRHKVPRSRAHPHPFHSRPNPGSPPNRTQRVLVPVLQNAISSRFKKLVHPPRAWTSAEGGLLAPAKNGNHGNPPSGDHPLNETERCILPCFFSLVSASAPAGTDGTAGSRERERERERERHENISRKHLAREHNERRARVYALRLIVMVRSTVRDRPAYSEGYAWVAGDQRKCARRSGRAGEE